ncbi:PID-CTERM protein-sorting domain-containing protein [Fodinibius sp. Rm-B-1B1-1]|uniref:PID-CTERM protein-sorting domain-containing protein n=1 Tax=Fodinibius alkaliphilus TaxID=3140241 RepID=UPI00315A2CA4
MKSVLPRFVKENYQLIFGITVFASLLFVIPDSMTAQPELWDGEDSQEVPIDGGLGILAAVGGAYAIKKLRNKE